MMSGGRRGSNPAKATLLEPRQASPPSVVISHRPEGLPSVAPAPSPSPYLSEVARQVAPPLPALQRPPLSAPSLFNSSRRLASALAQFVFTVSALTVLHHIFLCFRISFLRDALAQMLSNTVAAIVDGNLEAAATNLVVLKQAANHHGDLEQWLTAMMVSTLCLQIKMRTPPPPSGALHHPATQMLHDLSHCFWHALFTAPGCCDCHRRSPVAAPPPRSAGTRRIRRLSPPCSSPPAPTPPPRIGRWGEVAIVGVEAERRCRGPRGSVRRSVRRSSVGGEGRRQRWLSEGEGRKRRWPSGGGPEAALAIGGRAGSGVGRRGEGRKRRRSVGGRRGERARAGAWRLEGRTGEKRVRALEGFILKI